MGSGKQVEWPVLQDDNLARFLSNPVADMPIQSDVFSPMFMDPNFTHAGPISGALCPGEWEPASSQSAAILQALLGKSVMLNLNDQEQADIAQHLNFLFVPSKIEKSINYYFELWHPHCPMVHRPSFSIERTPVALLISMTLMGAMYSEVDIEVGSAKVVLDLAELFIYGLDDLSDEFEIQQMLTFSTTSPQSRRPVPSYEALNNTQAAYLMIVIQTWAGNMPARKRACESRFPTVVKVKLRRLTPECSLTADYRWLEDLVSRKRDMTLVLAGKKVYGLKKSVRFGNAAVTALVANHFINIFCRLINAMTLLDSAFVFFSNFPSRLSVNEMKFDFHSDEALFASAHPFSEPTFLPSRQLTVHEVFRSLFSQEKSQPPDEIEINQLGLNVVDMFTLIHRMYPKHSPCLSSC